MPFLYLQVIPFFNLVVVSVPVYPPSPPPNMFGLAASFSAARHKLDLVQTLALLEVLNRWASKFVRRGKLKVIIKIFPGSEAIGSFSTASALRFKTPTFSVVGNRALPPAS